MLSASLVAAAVLCCVLYRYVTRTFDYWKSRNVAGPAPRPLFGNLMDSALRRKNVGVVFKEIYDQFPDEKVVGVYRMTTPCLLIRDVDIVKDVLIRDFDSFSDRGFFFKENSFGKNLFHADHKTWRTLRNRFAPMFTSGKIKNMIYLLEERADKLVDYIEHSTHSEQDVLSLFKMYTMATISACAFGLDINTISDKMDILKKLDKVMFAPSVFDELDMMYPGAFAKLNCDPVPREVRSFFSEMVATVIQDRNGVPSGRRDFMDLLLEMRQENKIHWNKTNNKEINLNLELTNKMIAAQALVFYGAGYETSASTMAIMAYVLANHPEVQDKVVAEVDAVLNKYAGALPVEALNELTYMEKVLNETLRLYPAVEPLQRRALHDYNIQGTNVTVKKNQLIFISTLGIHHDEKYYRSPEEFDPERFAPENSTGRHPCAHLPFGNGPRNCVGMRFARYQIRVCLVKFFSKFRVAPSPRTPAAVEFMPQRVVMAPKGGLHLHIAPRRPPDGVKSTFYL